MKFNFEIAENFANLKDFLINIQNNFKKGKNSIHKARNEIKVIPFKGQKIVVKSFKIPFFLKGLIYTYFKKSKAKKSYENALKISAFTPAPIAFIEFFKFGILNKSYFLSENFAYDFTIREVLLDKNFKKRKEILEEFAKFSFVLHENNIYHLDFSPGNILIKKDEEKFIFKIVDINRMKFIKLPLKLRMKAFKMLWADDEDLEIIAKKYAKLANFDEYECQVLAVFYSNLNKFIKNFKKKIRGKK